MWFLIVGIPVCLKTSTARCLSMPLKEMPLSKNLFFLPRILQSLYCKIFHPSYSSTFTLFCLLRYIQKREFYFYFIAFCARVLLAALDHNMHSFRPQATTKNGHLIFKKQYSKRTKHGHPEPVRAEKTYDYIQFLMASILKARVDDKDCCKGYFSSIRSPKESGPNHCLARKPRTDLFKDYRSRFDSKKEWGFSETSFLGADQRSGVCSFYHCWRNSLQTYSHLNSLIPLPKKF